MEEEQKKEYIPEDKEEGNKETSSHKKAEHKSQKKTLHKKAAKAEHKKEHKEEKPVHVKEIGAEEIKEEKEEAKEKKKPLINIEDSRLESIVIILTAVFLIIVLFNQYQIYSISGDLKEKVKEAEEAKKPAVVELVIIADRKCLECYDISPVVESISKNPGLNVTSQKALAFDDSEAKSLISKYQLDSLPTVIITGDVGKAERAVQGLTKLDDALVLVSIPPPYYEVASNEIRGLVTLTHLADSRCSKCSNTSGFSTQLRNAGVKIMDEKFFDISSDKGKELLQKYKIKAAPTVILSNDAAYYQIITQAWQGIGDIADDGSYVMRILAPPFVNVSTNEINGIINITYLTDKSCKECYDASQHRLILERGFGTYIGNETTADISEKKGKGLVEKYKITAVPTVIISEDAKYYRNLVQTWQSVGSIESDGVLIFRNFNAWPGHTYKDLSTNKTVENPTQQQQ